MLYIVSQNGLRITDLHAVSVVSPEHDREDDGVYKVYVNGAEFGRYKERGTIDQIMGAIKKFIHTNQNAYYEMPAGDYKDGDAL